MKSKKHYTAENINPEEVCNRCWQKECCSTHTGHNKKVNLNLAKRYCEKYAKDLPRILDVLNCEGDYS